MKGSEHNKMGNRWKVVVATFKEGDQWSCTKTENPYGSKEPTRAGHAVFQVESSAKTPSHGVGKAEVRLEELEGARSQATCRLS